MRLTRSPPRRPHAGSSFPNARCSLKKSMRGSFFAYAEGTTERQRELASRLGADERRVTLEEWISQQPNAADDQALLRVDGLY